MLRRLFLHSLLVVAPLILFCCVGEDPAPPPSTSPNNNPPGTDGGPTTSPQDAFDIIKLDNVTLLQGTSVEVPISFSRASYKGAINVTIADPPSGVSALPLSVPADATEAKLTLVAAPDAKQGSATIKVIAADIEGKTKREKTPSVLVRGPAGTLDQTFGQGGRAIIDADGLIGVAGLVVQNDGKVVVGGTLTNDFFLARLTAEGTTDATFGNTGQTRGDFVFNGSLTDDTALGLAISPDQTLVMSGYTITTSGSRYAVARFLPNGKLDTQFATVGYVYNVFTPRPEWQGNKFMHAVTVQPDGRVVVAGEIEAVTEGGYRMVMARIKTNGEFEPNQEFFGTFNTPSVTYDAHCHAVAMKDTKIVCGGTTEAQDMVAWRVNASKGEPDPTFQTATGVAYVSQTLVPAARTTDVHILAQGQVVLSGVSKATPTSPKAAIAVLSSVGAPDAQYNGKGSLVFDWDGVPVANESGLTATVRSRVDAQGRVVVAAAIGSPSYVGVARVNSTGDFDATFGPSGKRTITHQGEGDTKASSKPVIALGSHPDGRIVIATGIETTAGAMQKIVVYRLWN